MRKLVIVQSYILTMKLTCFKSREGSSSHLPTSLPLATQPWRRFSQNRYILHYFRLSLVLFSEVWSILTASVYWRRNYFFPSLLIVLRFADPCVATIYSNQSSGAVVWMKTSEALITKELISLLFVVLKEFADRFGILHSWSALLFFFSYYYYWN